MIRAYLLALTEAVALVAISYALILFFAVVTP
jgi:hypothetical protein